MPDEYPGTDPMPQRGTPRRPGVRGELPAEALVERIWAMSASHGAERIRRSGLSLLPARVVAPPLIRECRAHLEGKLQSVTRLGAEVVIFGPIAGLHRRGLPRLAPGRDSGVLLIAGRYESPQGEPGRAAPGHYDHPGAAGRRSARDRRDWPAGPGPGTVCHPALDGERSDQTACRTSVVTSITRGRDVSAPAGPSRA